MGQQPGKSGMGPGSGKIPPPHVTAIIKPRPKWYALWIIASILKILAWMSVGLGVIAVLAALIPGNQFGNPGFIERFVFAVAALLGVGAVFLLLYSRAEQMLLLIAIEENTRKL